MGRGITQMKFIEKKGLRSSTYRKRLQNLKKKAFELSILCDVPTMIISIESDGRVDTFPENKEEISFILEKYHSVSNVVREKYRQSPESCLVSQINKKKLELSCLTNMIKKDIDSLNLRLLKVQDRVSLINNQSTVFHGVDVLEGTNPIADGYKQIEDMFDFELPDVLSIEETLDFLYSKNESGKEVDDCLMDCNANLYIPDAENTNSRSMNELAMEKQVSNVNEENEVADIAQLPGYEQTEVESDVFEFSLPDILEVEEICDCLYSEKESRREVDDCLMDYNSYLYNPDAENMENEVVDIALDIDDYFDFDSYSKNESGTRVEFLA